MRINIIKKPIADYLKLYLILETKFLKIPLDEFLTQIIEGGVTSIQLRDKDKSDKERYETALTLKNIIACRDILFIINDNVDISLAVGADGVHLGIKDLMPHKARLMMGDKIIGYSCNTLADCEVASEICDYAGVGPLFPTGTKKDLREVIGFDGVRRNAEYLKIPSAAIGGINLSNAAEAIDKCRVNGLCVSSALCSSLNPYDDTVAFRKIIDERI